MFPDFLIMGSFNGLLTLLNTTIGKVIMCKPNKGGNSLTIWNKYFKQLYVVILENTYTAIIM